MKTRILITLTALLIGVAASAKDLRTVVFYVKDMHCENCEKKVKENIRFEKGLKSLSTDVDSRTVTITYDADKTSVEELQAGFAKFNYTAELVSDQSNTEINAAKTGSSSSSGKTTTTDSKTTTTGSKTTATDSKATTTDSKSATQTTTKSTTGTTQKATGDQPTEVEPQAGVQPQAGEGQQPPTEGGESDEPGQSTATQSGKTTQSTQATQSTQTSKTTQSSQSTQKK